MTVRRVWILLLTLGSLTSGLPAWAQAPELEKSIVVEEGRSLKGVAFKDDSGDIFGVDAEVGRVFRWSDILDRADLSRAQADFSFALDGAVADLGWMDVRDFLFVARGATWRPTISSVAARSSLCPSRVSRSAGWRWTAAISS